MPNKGTKRKIRSFRGTLNSKRNFNFKKILLLRCIHHSKSNLIRNMDHTRISGTECLTDNLFVKHESASYDHLTEACDNNDMIITIQGNILVYIMQYLHKAIHTLYTQNLGDGNRKYIHLYRATGPCSYT